VSQRRCRVLIPQ